MTDAKLKTHQSKFNTLSKKSAEDYIILKKII